MSKRLEMKFRNEDGRLVTISMDDPKYPVDPEQVKQVMDKIVAEDVFTSNDQSITEISHAQVVERTVEDVTLEM
ncbi:DUF2922 domain-containing protein [Alkalibacillus aidingensis]|uniref:DUF2922 domain-containing protein n=1 Tax=Alkalibacillus aidingensis TaxID=2747607 RepID=UPI0016605153|nr:DUF2922 domain-containing protein [Alkalibacillus aidingensis]